MAKISKVIEGGIAAAGVVSLAASAAAGGVPSEVKAHEIFAQEGLAKNRAQIFSLNAEQLAELGYQLPVNVDMAEPAFGMKEEEKPPVPLSNGNYEFWSIAKLKLETDPATGKSKYVNTVAPGEPGYVYGIEQEGGFPYRVAGYYFVQEEQIEGPGVSLFEYRPIEQDQ